MFRFNIEIGDFSMILIHDSTKSFWKWVISIGDKVNAWHSIAFFDRQIFTRHSDLTGE